MKRTVIHRRKRVQMARKYPEPIRQSHHRSHQQHHQQQSFLSNTYAAENEQQGQQTPQVFYHYKTVDHSRDIDHSPKNENITDFEFNHLNKRRDSNKSISSNSGVVSNPQPDYLHPSPNKIGTASSSSDLLHLSPIHEDIPSNETTPASLPNLRTLMSSLMNDDNINNRKTPSKPNESSLPWLSSISDSSSTTRTAALTSMLLLEPNKFCEALEARREQLQVELNSINNLLTHSSSIVRNMKPLDKSEDRINLMRNERRSSSPKNDALGSLFESIKNTTHQKGKHPTRPPVGMGDPAVTSLFNDNHNISRRHSSSVIYENHLNNSKRNS
jgi:hypothetical protein